MFQFSREEHEGGAGHFSIANCDKDGSIVSTRLASICGGVSDTRPIKIEVSEFASEHTFEILAEKVVQMYNNVTGQHTDDFKHSMEEEHTIKPLLNVSNDIVVLGSVHRAGLYVAEVLHAKFLPLQFLSFAENWEQAEAASKGATVIVGSDFGADMLWLWNKITSPSQLPTVYLELLRSAKQIFVVRSTDKDTSCFGIYRGMYLHGSCRPREGFPEVTKLYKQIKDDIVSLPKGSLHHLRQWEWGLPDDTINAIRNVWGNKLGKRQDDMVVLEGDTVQLYKFITPLWQDYLNANSIHVRGFTFNSYWIAHPALERACGLVPFHFYRFSWHGSGCTSPRDFAERYLSEFNQTFATNTFAFVNNIGHESDVREVKDFLSKKKMNTQCWFSVGGDCVGAKCVDFDSYLRSAGQEAVGVGEKILLPHEKAMEVLRSTSAAHKGKCDWKPISSKMMAVLWMRSVNSHRLDLHRNARQNRSGSDTSDD